jgi:hypothetical protein
VDGVEFAQPLMAPVTPPVVPISAVSPTAAGSPPSATEPAESASEPELLDLGDHSRRGEE